MCFSPMLFHASFISAFDIFQPNKVNKGHKVHSHVILSRDPKHETKLTIPSEPFKRGSSEASPTCFRLDSP